MSVLSGSGRRLSGVAVLFASSAAALACGTGKLDPAIGSGDDDSTFDPVTPVIDAASTDEPSTGDGTTHLAIEPCEAHLGASDCDAAGCIWFASEQIVDLGTCALTPAGFCATASGSTADDSHDSTFYRRIDGVLQLHRVGHRSCDRSGSAHPQGWTECGVGPGDPPECDCVCAAGQCPGDLARERLDACALPRPCPDVGRDWGGEECLYRALAAGAAASLRVHRGPGDPELDQRVYLRGDGTAQWLSRTCDDDCPGCSAPTWELPRACALREPAYFAACAATDDPAIRAACRDLSTWFTGCARAPATCP